MAWEGKAQWEERLFLVIAAFFSPLSSPAFLPIYRSNESLVCVGLTCNAGVSNDDSDLGRRLEHSLTGPVQT